MTSSFRSNMDHACAIARSIFVTNFPDSTSSKDLWKLCQPYGIVVDVYIPNRRSKAGKRFAFVRFIKVDNVDRLVGNLCYTDASWITDQEDYTSTSGWIFTLGRNNIVWKTKQMMTRPRYTSWKKRDNVPKSVRRLNPSILEGYTDASWITDQEDYTSTSEWIFTLGG
nr:ChaC-like family protein [Tanacetum cinerariifolium]